jgi:transcriptional regulator GlxA family with amidase domain
MSGHLVALAVTDGVPMLEFAVPHEVFGIDRRDLVDPWYDLRLCAGEPGPLRIADSLLVEAPHPLEALVEADTVIVPALARRTQIDPPAALVDAVRAAHHAGRRIVSLCTGAYVLAAAGLLDGRRATLHWMNAMDFAHRHPRVRLDPQVLYVDEGDVLTSAGTAAAIDLCLHMVRSDHGTAVANEVARRMVTPPHRAGGQAQYVRLPATVEDDDPLAEVLDWARHHLDEPLTVADLAARSHLSPRTLARRFRDVLGTTPLHWLLTERVRTAQELLETTDEPVERIAARSGFGTAANLRQHFARTTTVSPQTYRQVFRRGRADRGPARPPTGSVALGAHGQETAAGS